MHTKVWQGRQAARAIAAILLVPLLLAGCDGRSTHASGTSSRPAGKNAGLANIEACKLATPEEVSAALAAPAGGTEPMGVRSDGAVGCRFSAATGDTVLSLGIEPDGKERYDIMKTSDGTPIPGLGDEATANAPSANDSAEVVVLKGDLVISVYATGLTPAAQRDRAATNARLATLLGAILARLPR
jgi:hypothetical protein